VSTGSTAPEASAATYATRLARARASLPGSAALLLGLGADLQYLTGHSSYPTERLTMLVLPATGPATLVAPRLEAMAAAQAPAAASGQVEVVAWDETDDPVSIVAARVAEAIPGDRPTLLVNAGLWSGHLLRLQAALPGADFGLASRVTRALRIVKDPTEIESLRLAAGAADRALAEVASGPLVGRTEVEVSREIRDRLVAEGHDAASFAIVGSGPNGASPHHEAGHRVIEAGEPVVLDIGGTYRGYGSDVTRTIWVTGRRRPRRPTSEFLEVHETVRRAQAAATAAVRPGVTAAALDGVARRVVSDAGHGPAFLHRTGHGIGLEGHEEPYLVAGNDEPIEPGMAFSIEPGIYLAGRFGVRIEDVVVCVGEGAEVLNTLRREAWVVSG
jgi:Xaa-Pro aminopeptidase